MGTRIVRKIGLIIAVISMYTGFVILYEIFASELVYHIDKPVEEHIIEHIE